MPATATYGATGNAGVDALLSGTKWAVNSLTFSFPSDPSFYGTSYGSGEPSNGFAAFTAAQQAAVRSALANYSAVANLTFTEVTETSTQHGTLRYAESNTTSTAWGYYPSTAEIGGDSWYNNASNWYASPVKGNYAYSILMHETGHTLGLKHPHEASGSFGTMPAQYDSIEYTVMSYRAYAGASTTSGYTADWNSYPQTLMMYDIAALQKLYGANFTTNAGNTVYKWDAATGQEFIDGVGQGAPSANKVFMTVWDGGGNDTYDFSNYTANLKVDLNPGGWTTVSAGQLAYLGDGHYAVGNIANAMPYQSNTASLIENAIGGSGSDTITGNQADNRLTGGAGNDALDGGLGTDTAVYSGLRANYAWVQNADGSWTITDLRGGSPDGVDALKNIELLQFSDSQVTIGTAPAVNHAPTITSGAQAGAVTEWADNSAAEIANTTHTASGAVTYADSDTLDTHTASFAAKGSGYLGTFSLGTGSIDTGHSIGWSFAVSDSAIDYLAAGQTLTQQYDVSVDDGHGGTATQTVTITINGTADAAAANHAPRITSATQTGAVTEWADKSANEVANTAHTASGAVTYADSDALDIHTASFTVHGGGYLGTFSLNTSGIDAAHSVGWSYVVSDSAIDYLKAGQKLTQEYDVRINDGHGGIAKQTVTITITGADDAAAAGGKRPAATETAGNGNSHSDKIDMSQDNAPAPAHQDSFSFQSLASASGLSMLDHILLASNSSSGHDLGLHLPSDDHGVLHAVIVHDVMDKHADHLFG